MQKTYKALVIGATGLIGKYLVTELLADELCKELHIFVRKDMQSWHEKLKIHKIDFDKEETYSQLIDADVLFSTLGTTRADAKSKENHYLVDHNYQYNIAKLAKEKGIKNYILVSSPLLNENSSNYYRRMKWEIERDIKELNFDKTIFLRPNPLMGKRNNKRFGEHYAVKILEFLIEKFSIFKKLKPILAKDVAKVMVKSFKDSTNCKDLFILERLELDTYLKN